MKHKTFRTTLPALLSLCALQLFGCARPVEGRGPVATYALNRCHDLIDIFGLRINGPKKARAFGVHVRATALAQLGAVYFDGVEAGFDRRAAGIWRTKRIQGAIGPVAATRIEMRTISGNDFAWWGHPWNQERERGIVRNGEFWDDGRRQFMAFGVEIEPGIIPGFEVRFNPIEVLDFIAGFATLDMNEDDLKTSYTKIVYDWENDPYRFKPATDYVEPERNEKGEPITPMTGKGTSMHGAGKSEPLPVPSPEPESPPSGEKKSEAQPAESKPGEADMTGAAPVEGTDAATPTAMPTPIWVRTPSEGTTEPPVEPAEPDEPGAVKKKGPPNRHEQNMRSSWWFSGMFRRNK